MVELLTAHMEIPDEANIMIGKSHFIKTVEDIYEAPRGKPFTAPKSQSTYRRPQFFGGDHTLLSALGPLAAPALVAPSTSIRRPLFTSYTYP